MALLFVGDWMSSAQLLSCPRGGGVIGNLECAFANGEVTSEKAYTSVVPRKCMAYVGKAGFRALSLANNHVNDAGNFDETYAALQAANAGVQFFGTVDCPYAEFNLDDAAKRKVIVIGCLEPCRSRGSRIFRQEDVLSLIRQLRISSGLREAIILVYPHWGMEGEYTRYPSPAQRALARQWIDAGADGVFGSHSHVPQGRELYQGKPIYYSLGNFAFDHPESKLYAGTEDRLTVAVDFGEGGPVVRESFSSDDARAAVEAASAVLRDWSTWRWARAVGPFNLRKNMASWKLRLVRNPLKTLPKFLVWQFLPKVLLFRLAALVNHFFGAPTSVK